jgi:hypothetical protein
VSAVQKHCVAKDLVNFDHAKTALGDHVTRFDMYSVFLVPCDFDMLDPTVALRCKSFIDILKNPDAIDHDRAVEWQTYFNAWVSADDIESSNWMVDCLKLSMDTELLAEVESDMVQLSPIQTGAVTTYHAMAARINRRSQEAEDNLHRFIEEFNIRKFDN